MRYCNQTRTANRPVNIMDAAVMAPIPVHEVLRPRAAPPVVPEVGALPVEVEPFELPVLVGLEVPVLLPPPLPLAVKVLINVISK